MCRIVFILKANARNAMSSLFSNSENKLLNYDFSRWMGNTSGSDFDFRALGSALDCTRDFN